MRSGRSYVWALTGMIAVALTAWGPARAETASYLGSAACKGCHAQVAQGEPGAAHGKALADPQLPEGQRECEACHGPGSGHVQATGKQPLPNPATLPAREAQALCGTCHFASKGAPTGAPKLSAEQWAQGAHARAGKSCTTCHHEHDGAKPPACLTCHRRLTEAPAGGTVHAPVKNGQCQLCHDPHGSAAPHELKPNVSASCQTCHQPEKLAAKHKGYSVAGSDCTRCHDPHSFAADKAYLRPRSHAPFAQGQCQACHLSPPSTALKKPGADTCYTCHPKATVLAQKDAAGKAIHAHPPVAAGMCTQCHEPHVSDQQAALRAAPAELCVTCHKSVGTALNATHPHPPAAQGKCLTCHAGHGAAEPALLRQEETKLCESCHAGQMKRMHPVGGETKDPKTGAPVTCTSCHAIHGSALPAILPQEETALCRSCHRMES